MKKETDIYSDSVLPMPVQNKWNPALHNDEKDELGDNEGFENSYLFAETADHYRLSTYAVVVLEIEEALRDIKKYTSARLSEMHLPSWSDLIKATKMKLRRK